MEQIMYAPESAEKVLLGMGSQALRTAALNTEAKKYLLSNPVLFDLVKRAADRYIGGETLAETLSKVLAANAEGYKCSMEFMGENIDSPREAIDATIEFVLICQRIKELKLRSTVSLDLSHIGLSISQQLCMDNLDRICEAASLSGTEVIISAEGPEQTETVLDTYRRVAARHPTLGITLQAYLFRTKEDLDSVLDFPGRVRIVKGAFAADPDIAMPRGARLDQAYLLYIDKLLLSKHRCSIATHDQMIQDEAKKLVDHYNPMAGFYEFESLFGIQTEALDRLKEEGYQTKLYFVYGKEWYLYLCNRIAEYPLNIFRALADIVH